MSILTASRGVERGLDEPVRRVGVEYLSARRGEHDLHVEERDGYCVRVEQVFSEHVVEVRCREHFRAVRAAIEEVFEDAAEQASTV